MRPLFNSGENVQSQCLFVAKKRVLTPSAPLIFPFKPEYTRRSPASATSSTSRWSPGSKRTAVPAAMFNRNPRACSRSNAQRRVDLVEMKVAAHLHRAVAGVRHDQHARLQARRWPPASPGSSRHDDLAGDHDADALRRWTATELPSGSVTMAVQQTGDSIASIVKGTSAAFRLATVPSKSSTSKATVPR